MTAPALLLAAMRVEGFHARIDTAREVLLEQPLFRAALTRAYNEGATMRRQGLKCDCAECKERAAAPRLEVSCAPSL